IVKQLVELHGGMIRAESPGLNQGATFCMTLPLGSRGIPAEQQLQNEFRQTEVRSAEQSQALSGLTVLVVDDDDDSRQFVARILKNGGAVVLEADSVQTALAMVIRDHPDVLLSDIGMPQLDGYDLIRKVRSLPGEAGGRIAAAAVTAMARSEDRPR